MVNKKNLNNYPQTEFIPGIGIPVEMYISDLIKNYFRLLKITKKDKLGICKFGNDVIYTDDSVLEHIDNTKKGYDTIICILLNDANFDFKYNGIFYKIKPGDVIRFNGNVKHALTVTNKYKGRFVALIWDIPVDNSFVKECTLIANRLIELIFETFRTVKKSI